MAERFKRKPVPPVPREFGRQMKIDFRKVAQIDFTDKTKLDVYLRDTYGGYLYSGEINRVAFAKESLLHNLEHDYPQYTDKDEFRRRLFVLDRRALVELNIQRTAFLKDERMVVMLIPMWNGNGLYDNYRLVSPFNVGDMPDGKTFVEGENHDYTIKIDGKLSVFSALKWSAIPIFFSNSIKQNTVKSFNSKSVV